MALQDDPTVRAGEGGLGRLGGALTTSASTRRWTTAHPQRPRPCGQVVTLAQEGEAGRKLT